jgi:GTP-binding protein EngB required for normal cell division
VNEGGPLDARLARLREAVEAARSIGLEEEAAAARAVARRVGRRAGFGGEVYVMALAGGTGVGKSSVLNALAGTEVSEVRAVRPTTDRPLAWAAAKRQKEVAPLLEWLKVDRVVPHDGKRLADVVVLDLPDVDSVKMDHRATVDTLLPRIDTVTWIVDPEKYDDARMHTYWRTLAPHAERLRFVLNKADRLSEPDRRLVADDLRARLIAAGIPRPVLHVVSATEGDGVDALRDSLADAAHAKVIVASKLEADRADAAAGLAEAVGLQSDDGYQPLLPDAVREAHVAAAVAGARELVDPDGMARQIQAAVLHQARIGGGSFLGRLVALAGTLTGRRRRRADPAANLAAWRTRGALGRVLNPLRAALVEAAASVPPASRGRVLDALGAPTAEAEVTRALDRLTREEAAAFELPRSPVWPFIGVLQVAVGAVLVFALAWIVVLFVSGGGVPVATFEVPILGPLPMPLALLAASLLVSALLGWILALHAGWVGRRVAARVEARTEAAIRDAIATDAFGGLDRVEEERRVIAAATERT